MSYEWLDDDEELEMVPVVNQNNCNNYNLVNNSESESSVEEIFLVRHSTQKSK